MRLIAGIDTAMPDVRKKWSYHAAWNQNADLWQADFRQLADLGFRLLRWQMPWSLVEPQPGSYRWDLLDRKVELATELGLEILYPVMHFNLPRWLAEGERHAIYSERLADRLAMYTEQLLSRYGFRLVIPIVEVQMEACQRGLLGNWQPHVRNRREYQAMHANLVGAFQASAAVVREYNGTVLCSEPATELSTVLALGNSVDVAGIDLYPHMHRKQSILGYFRKWSRATKLPLCLSEFGIPETYNPETQRDARGRFVIAGDDKHRLAQVQILRESLRAAELEGIPFPLGGWYPAIGNIGWGSALTRERKKLDCDRAGLVDLTRQPDGSLLRVLCPDLIREVFTLADVSTYSPAVQINRSTNASMPPFPLGAPKPDAPELPV